MQRKEEISRKNYFKRIVWLEKSEDIRSIIVYRAYVYKKLPKYSMSSIILLSEGKSNLLIQEKCGKLNYKYKLLK